MAEEKVLNLANINDLITRLESDNKGSTFLHENRIVEVERLKSGSLGVDLATGGGYAKGKIVEIYGPESSGKTTLAILTLIENQEEAKKENKFYLFIDSEQAFDKDYAVNLGLDLSRLILVQPDNCEAVFDIIETACKTNHIHTIIWDSVEASATKAEVEGDIEDSNMGVKARLMSKGLRKITKPVADSKLLLICINQLRTKLGVMFGNPEVVTGGNAMKFYAAIRIDIRKVNPETKEGADEPLENLVKVKIVKNKLAAPFRKCEFKIKYNEGINYADEIFKAAVARNILVRGGAWYSHGENKVGQGEASTVAAIASNETLQQELVEKIYITPIPITVKKKKNDKKEEEEF